MFHSSGKTGWFRTERHRAFIKRSVSPWSVRSEVKTTVKCSQRSLTVLLRVEVTQQGDPGVEPGTESGAGRPSRSFSRDRLAVPCVNIFQVGISGTMKSRLPGRILGLLLTVVSNTTKWRRMDYKTALGTDATAVSRLRFGVNILRRECRQ